MGELADAGETFMNQMQRDVAREIAKALLALAIQRERLERVMETTIDFTPAEEVWVRAFREAK
jgi:hypothetical protein